MSRTASAQRSDPRPGRRRLAATALLALIVAWGVVQSVRHAPAPRERPRRVHWLERYEPLRRPLAAAGSAVYLNDPDIRGKYRFFRAQYVLTPVTLHLHRSLDRTLETTSFRHPLIIDYRRQRDLAAALQTVRRRAAEGGIPVTIDKLGPGLALVRDAR